MVKKLDKLPEYNGEDLQSDIEKSPEKRSPNFHLFYAHCIDEYAAENLQFLMAVAELENLSDKECRDQYAEIYESFKIGEEVMGVNISGDARDDMYALYTAQPPKTKDEIVAGVRRACSDIRLNLEEDKLPGFEAKKAGYVSFIKGAERFGLSEKPASLSQFFWRIIDRKGYEDCKAQKDKLTQPDKFYPNYSRDIQPVTKVTLGVEDITKLTEKYIERNQTYNTYAQEMRSIMKEYWQTEKPYHGDFDSRLQASPEIQKEFIADLDALETQLNTGVYEQQMGELFSDADIQKTIKQRLSAAKEEAVGKQEPRPDDSKEEKLDTGPSSGP